MKIESVTKIIALVVGATLILMAIAQFANMVGFAQTMASYNIFPQYGRLWAVVFMVGEFLAGVGLIAGWSNPGLFRSSAVLGFVVFAGWFVFGLVGSNTNVVVQNTGFFGVFFAQPLSLLTQVEVVVMALLALFLAVQGMFFAHRGSMY